MTHYTLIAFTQGSDGWHDRCGDYNEGEPSELDITHYTDPKECGFMWAYTERQYETTKLLIDGRDAFDDSGEGTERDQTEYDRLQGLHDEADTYRDERSKELKAEHDKREQEKRDMVAAHEAAEAAKRRAVTERIEREQLAALQRKYGGM